MKESGDISVMDNPREDIIPVHKTLIQIFNHPSRNGRIYIVDTKEDVLKVFGKFIEEKVPLILTSNDQAFDLGNNPEESNEDYFKRFLTVNLGKAAGIFKDIEIIETGDIGYNEKPIFEVRGNLKFLENNPNGTMAKELINENVMTIGMRSVGNEKLGFGSKTFEIEKVICFDLLNK